VSDTTWDRIAIVGCSGAGKTTLARRLAEATGAPHIELDELHFGPDWTPVPLDQFRERVDAATSAPRWVADGNYRPVRDLIWERATAIVCLDAPLITCFRRVCLRTVRRVVTREPVCNGNRETLWNALCTRDSILRWVLVSHGPRRRTLPRELCADEYAHLSVYRVQNRRETRRLLATVSRRTG